MKKVNQHLITATWLRRAELDSKFSLLKLGLLMYSLPQTDVELF